MPTTDKYSLDDDCKDSEIYDPQADRCIKGKSRRGEQLLDAYTSFLTGSKRKIDPSLEVEEEEEQLNESDFTLTPGDEGFNNEATFLMRGLLTEGVQCNKTPSSIQPYQKTVEWLTKPENPVKGLLVAHRTGAGKTRSMVAVLNNYFYDPRPKIVIFPTPDTRNQFYAELMYWDNEYKNYVYRRMNPGNRAMLQKLVADADKNKTKVNLPEALLEDLMHILELHGHPGKAGTEGYMAAPMRAYEYREFARASTVPPRMKNGPVCPNINGRPNRACNKIIVMDEAHNLPHPDPALIFHPVSLQNLRHLEEEMYESTNAVKVLFTATPIVKTFADARRILRAVKGRENEHKNDEGFISAFYSTPQSAFPLAIPNDRMLPTIVSVELAGDDLDFTTSLGNYVNRMMKADGTFNQEFMNNIRSRQFYDYTPAYVNNQSGKELHKDLVGKRAGVVAPKLYKAAQMIAAAKGKVIVITGRSNGFFNLATMIDNNSEFKDAIGGGKTRALLGKLNERSDYHPQKCGGVSSHGPKLSTCVKAEFDEESNDDGHAIKCLLLEASQYSEGSDFKTVQTIIMLDVPESWAKDMQRVGRAVRMCSHKRLPLDQQQVHTYLLVATLPDYARSHGRVHDLRTVLTVDELRLVDMIKQRDDIEGGMCQLINSAVDRATLSTVVEADHCPFHAEVMSHGGEEVTVGNHRCVSNYIRCQNRAFERFKGVMDSTEAVTECKKDYKACTKKKHAYDELELYCPRGHSEQECELFCTSRGLRGDAHTDCMNHQAAAPLGAQLVDEDPEAAPDTGEPCPNCGDDMSAGDCASFCIGQGLQGPDFYRCIARTNTKSCALRSRAPQEMPEGAPPLKNSRAAKEPAAKKARKPAARKKR